jgi:hypothetical protein
MRLFKHREKIKSANVADLTDAYSLLGDKKAQGSAKKTHNRNAQSKQRSQSKPETKRSDNQRSETAPSTQADTVNKSSPMEYDSFCESSNAKLSKEKDGRVGTEIGQIEIPPSPVEIRCERVWRQVCTESLRQSTTSDEKRALLNYLVIVSNLALELLKEVQSDDELYNKTHRNGGAKS